MADRESDEEQRRKQIPQPVYRKFHSKKRRKRKGFFGSRNRASFSNLPEETIHVAASTDDNNLGLGGPSCSRSADSGEGASGIKNVSLEKLLNTSFESDMDGPLTRAKAVDIGLVSPNSHSTSKGNSIMDKRLLIDAVNKAAMCKKCKSTKAKLVLKTKGFDGLAEHMSLVCSNCDAATNLETSKVNEGSSRLDKRGGKCGYEVNRRSVLASITSGHAGLERFCGIMNINPPINKMAYNKQMKQIESSSKKVAEIIMKDAAGRLKEIIEKEDESSMEVGHDGEKIARVAVTVDGTWQKRGYSSKNGAVFVLSVRTGEVLDFEVLSMVCFECRAHEKWDKDSQKYKTWLDSHKAVCPINHHGSSGDMESKGACKLFRRSIEKRGLKYSVMVGDGDTGCFGSVREALEREFGEEYQIEKEECVGHVQKRMGAGLRNLKKRSQGKKLADGKGLGGAGRLTDKMVDSIQNYYGKAIRGNKGNLKGMKDAISAIFKHMIRDDKESLEEQHSLCPRGKSTWCKFWKDASEKTKTYSESKRLPSAFQVELRPLFNRLSDDALLERCLMGVTQNQNEALHGVLWGICPKIRFCGKRKIEIAACQTISQFNIGSSSVADMLRACNIEPGHYTMKALRKMDQQRLKAAAFRVSKKYKDSRRQRRALRLKKKDKQEAYIAGGFDLKSTPEVMTRKSVKRKANITPKLSKKKPKKSMRLSAEDTINVGSSSPIESSEPPIVFAVPLEETVEK